MEQCAKNGEVIGRTQIWGRIETELGPVEDPDHLQEWDVLNSRLSPPVAIQTRQKLCLWCPFAQCRRVEVNCDMSFVRLNENIRRA